MPRALLATLVVAATAATAHAQWAPETPITATGSDVWGEGIATAGTTVHLVFGTNEVRYQRSTDEGATWSASSLLDGGTLHLTDPVIADGNDVWVIELKDIRNLTDWCCSRDLGNIYVLHSGDAGQTWDAPRRLTTARGAFRVSIAYAAGRLHLVWMDFRNGSWDTYYLRSTDRGATWEPERRIAISAGTFGAERPQVAARGDGVHVTIWDDRGTNPPCMAGPTFSFAVCPDTFYVGSTDGGVTWGPEVAVSPSGAALAGRNDIAVAGTSSVVINFNRAAENTADANPHMFTVRSADNGATWQPPIQLTNTPGSSDHGSIIGAGSSVYLAWHDSRGGSLAIYYRASSTEGASWDPEERVSTATTAESSTPLLAVTDGYVHALWLDHRSGTYQIYYRRRAVTGAPPLDAGAVDATLPLDAGVELDAAPGVDAPAAAAVDAGIDSTGTPGGCGCRTGSESAPSAFLIAAFAWLLTCRPRRRE